MLDYTAAADTIGAPPFSWASSYDPTPEATGAGLKALTYNFPGATEAQRCLGVSYHKATFPSCGNWLQRTKAGPFTSRLHSATPFMLLGVRPKLA